MPHQPRLIPHGLSRDQHSSLLEQASNAIGIEPSFAIDRVRFYLDQIRIAHSKNRIVNVRLAEAISVRLVELLQQWSDLPVDHKYWLGGAILYFLETGDHEHDFHSSIGFEDDAEVLNACLALTNRNSLCIKIEDFDDA